MCLSIKLGVGNFHSEDIGILGQDLVSKYLELTNQNLSKGDDVCSIPYSTQLHILQYNHAFRYKF